MATFGRLELPLRSPANDSLRLGRDCESDCRCREGVRDRVPQNSHDLLVFYQRVVYVGNVYRLIDCFTKKYIGAPGEIRTPGLLVRSQALYPTELRARIDRNSTGVAEREGFEPSKGF